jgi:DNA repair protein SbcC/Rad50
VRLVRLEMAGFGAFRDPTAVDFSDTDFFALVGPTGSGKSTVIDAVCFALYGCVPRYEDRRLTRYVITLGASEARVSLTFELERTVYIATRVVRRSSKGAVSTKEARLERVEADGTTTVLAGAERELNAKVEDLLRLDFDDFTKCVVLPQGEFARFLRAKGDERRELLVKLLNLEIYIEVGRRAGQRAETAKAAAGLRRQRLEVLAFATDEALSEATTRSRDLALLKDRAEQARPKIEESVRTAAAEQVAEGEARRLGQLLEKVVVPDAARELDAALDLAQQELGAAQAAATAAREARVTGETAVVNLPDLVELQGVLDAHDRRVTCLSTLDGARRTAAEKAEEEAAAQQALADEEEKLERAEAALADAEAAHKAVDLAQRLVVGEPCPVCKQVVKAKPIHHVPAVLATARHSRDAAAKAVRTARAALQTAAGVSGVATGAVSTLEKELQGLDARVEAHPDAEELAGTIGTVKEQLEALAAARKEEDAAATAVGAKRAALEALQARSGTLRQTYGALRDSVSALGPPAPAGVDLLVDWEELASWAAAELPVQMEAAERARAACAGHLELVRAQTQTLTDDCAALGVAAEGDIVVVLTEPARASTEAVVEARTIGAAIAEAKELENQVDELDAQAEVASTLRNLLRSNRFPEWLIAEALELLVIDASAMLRALTNDEFSLTLGEQEFMVIDHANADELRSARTLSGGETFQASLALALALSAQIRSMAAEGAPMLDALFLDEGFGTLDPETLETVAATIENLGQSGRMVGIITHVRELAARVPVRFEVQKSSRTATIERRTL